MTSLPESRASRGLVLGVALVSAATLAVQVLQTRLFSVMLWHHLTYMVVTVTLLGFAASGSLLALFPRLGRLGGDPRVTVSICCSLFGLTLIATFGVLGHSSLDTLDIEQDRSQYFYLFLHYAYLIVPFLCAGMAVAVALQQFPGSVHRTYFWNLLGSGFGAFLFLLLIRPLGGPGSLFCYASLGGVAGLLALSGSRRSWPGIGLALAALLLWPLTSAIPSLRSTLVPIRPAPSKAQSIFEKVMPLVADRLRQEDPKYPPIDDSLRYTLWTPTCRIDTLPMPPTLDDAKKDREDPDSAPRSTVHVFQDGDAPTVIWSGTYAAERPYDRHFYGLGYHFVEQPKVLVIGPGGGNDVETALHHGATSVTAVDINGDTLDLVKNEFGDYTHGLYSRPDVHVVHSEGRSYMRRAGEVYDLIQMSGTDTYAALSSGSYIFSESYLYTEEAFDDYFAHLTDRGVLCIIRFRFEPPRETLKLVATAARALQRLGVEDPSRNVIVVNQVDRQIQNLAMAIDKLPVGKQLQGMRRYLKEPMRYSFTIARKEPFRADEVAEIAKALPPMNAPGTVEHEVYYGAGYTGSDTEYGKLLAAMAKGKAAEQAFYASYPYNVEPAVDDKPFFFNFYSLGDVHLFGSSDDVGYEAITGSEPIGQYILVALLLQTGIATVLLVIVPLLRLGMGSAGASSRLRVITYFMALGLAYLLVEIATIQRFVLYLGHPTYSLTAGLATFLVFSGLGSATAGRFAGSRRLASAAALAVVALLAVHAVVLPAILRDTLAFPEAGRVAMTVAWIGPMAFAMGMPFPTGLGLLRGEAAGAIPWAFGVNGAASVVASIVSIVVAMQAGFTSVLLLAGALYLVAALTVPRE